MGQAAPKPLSTWPRNAPPGGIPGEPPEPWSPETRFGIDSRISVLQRHLKYEMFARLRHVLRHERLTEQQWRVVRAIHTFTFVDHAGLCRATGLTRSSMTRILRALAARNVIVYEWPKAKNTGRPKTRHYKVMLTNHGKRVIERVRKDAETRYLDAEAKFSEIDLRLMCHLMDRFVVALRGSEFEATDKPHRNTPHRDNYNGRWISNAEQARRKELTRILRDGY